MEQKSLLAAQLKKKHQYFLNHPSEKKRCFIGFDGFTDEIVKTVATRESCTKMTPMKKIAELAERISQASSLSGNVEFIVTHTKIGGNAPILTDALLKGGHLITFAGSIGKNNFVEPLFQEMADGCEEVFPLGPSSHSDALEFEDGKIIFGKLENLKNITYEQLVTTIGLSKLKEIFERSTLFISANWTMLTTMNHFWAMILKEILPLSKKKRWLFVDLADPTKRTDADLKEALNLLKKFSSTYYVIQGLNEAEAMRVAKVLSLPIKGNSQENLLDLAQAIRLASGLQEVIIHATQFACSTAEEGSWIVQGPYTEKPLITTGAGDNFNAGYCNALLYDLNGEQRLLAGVATSGYYVRTGKSPTIDQLVEFLQKWR
ncbi:Ribokinase/pfkB superfamily [Chlamydiales bacterium STE3]|nr:Ribokinase/pfkB superfamily [Chlamydiales bacterium STE3]